MNRQRCDFELVAPGRIRCRTCGKEYLQPSAPLRACPGKRPPLAQLDTEGRREKAEGRPADHPSPFSVHRRTGDGYTLDQQLAHLVAALPPGTPPPPDYTASLAVCRAGCAEWTGAGCRLLESLSRCEVALPKALLGLHPPCPRWPV